MWFMESCSALRGPEDFKGGSRLQRKLISRERYEGARSGVLKHKKKARRRGDAPSNKRYGNCLLGFHCSQKHRPGNRTSIGSPAVAGRQQGISSTTYPQVLVDLLWIKSCRRRQAAHDCLAQDTAFRQRVEALILAVGANNPRTGPAQVSRRQLSSKRWTTRQAAGAQACRIAESPSWPAAVFLTLSGLAPA